MGLAVNSAVERVAKDSDGEFLRSAKCMAGSASGAVFIVSASGKNLGIARPYGKDFEISLWKKLEAWKALPPAERAPSGVKVKPRTSGDPSRAAHELPEGAIVIRVSNRPLERDPGSKTGFRYVVAEDYPEKIGREAIRRDWARYAQPADDFLWITATEWKSLTPARPKVGQNVAVPDAVVRRILQFHLVPSRGLGEGTGWHARHIREGRIDLTVHQVTRKTVVLELQGSASFLSHYRKKDDPLIYKPYLYGRVEIDRQRGICTRFDVLALGDLTGSPNGENQLGRRMGTHPLAVAFQLVDPAKMPAMKLHPRGLRDHPDRYWKPLKR